MRDGFDGTVVTCIPPTNVVVAKVTLGSNVTLASGTESVMAGVVGMVIVCPVKWIVTGVEPRPLGLSTPLNQM